MAQLSWTAKHQPQSAVYFTTSCEDLCQNYLKNDILNATDKRRYVVVCNKLLWFVSELPSLRYL